jgi:hypothetical protein
VNTAFIAVEGVLGEHSTLHGFAPIPDGIKLATALRSLYRLVLGTNQPRPEPVEQWLHINGLVIPSFYGQLLHRQAPYLDLDPPDLYAGFVSQLRASGTDLSLVVAGDPETVLRATELGLPCLLFVNPAYRWSEYRPDRKRLPRPWQDIEDEVVRQRELKATDPRLNEMEDA